MIRINQKYQKIKIMKNLAILFCIVVPFLTLAQSTGYHQFQQGNTYYLLGDNINVRSEASTSSEIIATLPIMKEITFERWNTSTLTIGGYTTKWAKISFKHPTKKKKMTGYIWGGFIAEKVVKSIADPTISFVYGVSKLKQNQYNHHVVMLQVRVIKDGKEIYKTTFEAIGPEHHINHNASSLGSPGLTGILDVLEFDFSQDMCGGAFGQIVLFWDGIKLHYVKLLRDGADAPMYWEESLIYPSNKGGKKDRIIFKSEEGGENDKGQTYSDVHMSEYYWTGTKLEKINK